ncbi:MAG: GreA/GreB family elongation factor [Kiritimatiellae bacterium]|nr:GreA/GreB family elongation factor [Kiritimatiellia bacterium]
MNNDAKKAFQMQLMNLLDVETVDVAAVTALIHTHLPLDAKEATKAFINLTETVVSAKDLAGAVTCCAFYAAHAAQMPEITLPQMREVIRRSAVSANDKLLVDSIGLNTAVAATIARRLTVLLALKPGVYVNSQSWGFGQIQSIDEFYGKVIIDFNGKKGHAMSLSVASQNLSVADDDHLMVRYMKDPEAIQALAEKHPGELVRLTLQSYGEMSVVRLAERLAETKLVPEANWKKFWEAARRNLKADKAHPVEIPTKRTDPIRLLDAEEDYGDKWLAKFAKLRDIKAIYEGVFALLAAKKNELPDSYRDTVTARLKFALKGADRTDYPRYAQVAVLMRNLGLSTEAEQNVQAATILENDEEDNLLLTMRGLSSRDVSALTGFLLTVNADSKAILLDHLPDYNSTALSAVLDTMRGDDAAATAVNRILACPTPVPTVVVWALRNATSAAAWNLPPLNDLITQAIHIVEQRHTGENLKMRNTLQGFFDNAHWLEEVCGKLSSFERQMMFERIQASSAWEPASQRNILVRMVRFDSELSRFRRQVKAQIATEQEHITSQRSLAALKFAYDYLVNTEIPKNAQDIATARSFGDLRENSEYQYAKDQQRMLISRQGEMARRLQMLKATDFTDVDCSTVKPGTCVTIQMASGSTTYTILGELDSDEALNIISCRTRLAVALMGNAEGETVEIPAEKGTITATISAIAPLSDAVRAWLADVPTSHVPNA